MAKVIRIKMMGNVVELELTDNILTQSTVKSQFLLPPDAVIALNYKVHGRKRGCLTRNDPEPCFTLPNNWANMSFSVESDRAPSRPATPAEMDRSLTLIEVEKANRVLRITNFWESRVFRIIGDKLTGTCVLVNDRHILSAAHLSFKLNHLYRITGTEGRSFNVKCDYICKTRDFALLQSDDLQNMDLPFDNLSRGMKFYVMGYPSIDASSPTFTKGIIEGYKDDSIHLVGSLGSRKGYSGSPVFTESGKLGGILLGGTAGLSLDTTLRECIDSSDEQNYTRILPIGIIIHCHKKENSSSES